MMIEAAVLVFILLAAVGAVVWIGVEVVKIATSGDWWV